MVLLLATLASACAVNDEARRCEDAVAALVESESFAGARVGVVVADAATGAVLASRSADRGFAPASNLKLVSSAVALLSLGPTYRMATELLRHGPVQDGVLHGDLVLRGFGDPTLGLPGPGEAAVAGLVAAVQALGIHRVTGRVIGDGSWLGSESLGLGWQWDYLDEDYAAPFGGLDYAGNLVTIRIRPGAQQPIVAVRPDGIALPTMHVVQGPVGSPTKLSAHRQLGADAIEVHGTIAADSGPVVLAVAVREPATFAAESFAARLRATGILVTEPEASASMQGDEPEQLLARVDSPPLADLVRHLLTVSDNLQAEQIWRTSARAANGTVSTQAAAAHAKAVLTKAGVDVQGMVLADGSGLSRRNLVQPQQLLRILITMYGSPLREAFTAGLPVAGQTGTLRTRLKTGPAAGRVRAKTGYISRVVCLSGYVPRPDPNAAPLAFSVMVNDFTCDDAQAKALVDTFVQRLAAMAGW